MSKTKQQGKNKTTALKVPHRTAPLPDTLTPVPGYPTKLCIYKLAASCYWWVRYYDGKIYRRSTKTDDKNKAYAFAKKFYDEIQLKRAQGLAVTSKTRFEACAAAMLKTMEAKIARKELTQDTYDIAKLRLNKTVLPFFAGMDVADVHYEKLEAFLLMLSHKGGAKGFGKEKEQLSSSTINSYLKLVRGVLGQAFKSRFIPAVPTFPTVNVADNARGYFGTREYSDLWRRALKLNGQQFDVRKMPGKNGQEGKGQFVETVKGNNKGRLVRRVRITHDLHELVLFMVNSFMRPTDLKNLQHKHVQKVERHGCKFLVLNLPPSKKHDKPIATMELAVKVYDRLKNKHKAAGLGVGPNDYVFMPQYANRDYAYKELARQFDVLLWSTGLGKDARGADRTLYSLRHTCIMYRLMFGVGMSTLVLAKNARTGEDMLKRFYASQLEGVDNIKMLQSRRRKQQVTKRPEDYIEEVVAE